ncbi:ATP-dependent helicase HRQ1 [Rhynchospora pubera]|uniref:ATP-dependent helicase HRQ1 n=1 Tax=Rhynchospora pubera TaxID=906938 RepID=A0AAV8CMC5_9POAL|nr:ATP-dependent helicase HRQ1 [Rhynchospora pubera]
MEKVVQIRTLDGQSITIKAPPDRLIRDLKLLLVESFLPAKNCPNFHLFFKGSKLSLEAQIGSIDDNEFLVFVPFTKKRQQTQTISTTSNRSAASSEPAELSHASASTWQDIMSDLSSLSDIPQSETNMKNLSSDVPLNKRSKVSSGNEDVIKEILSTNLEDTFDKKFGGAVQQVLDSVSCLSDGYSESCLLFSEFFRFSGGDAKCACSPWLKRLVKVFTLFNLFYGVVQMKNKCAMDWGYLEGVLKKHAMFGIGEVLMSDLETLSYLCPKIFILAAQEDKVTNSSCSIIVRTSLDHELISETKERRRPTSASVINAISKRWNVFRADLWSSIKYCMKQRQRTNMPLEISVEELISIKQQTSRSKCCNTKGVKINAHRVGCLGMEALEPVEMIEHLKEGLGKQGQIAHVKKFEAKEGIYVEIPENISKEVKEALGQLSITRLYYHQAEAIQLVLSGKSVVVATSTSSGKSLCYNIPVVETLSKSSMACALYVFPTKALSQDQLRTLLKLKEALNIPDLNIGIYDGDTPKEDRAWIRDNARIIITNPDMLHVSILPHHSQFQHILSNLRFIVIDEAHIYKGAFGCHTSLVLRRLRRICSTVYGSNPTFIFCTATSANPREHAMELTNLDNLELIQKDWSPCSPKYFLLWNPPLRSIGGSMNLGNDEKIVKAVLNRRTSPIMEVSYLFAEMVQHGLKCIAFCKTRKLCELVLSYTRDVLKEASKHLVDAIAVYRAGYIAEDRRKIESDLFDGKLRGVAATSALELGIDVGHIDATLHLGFPGTVASLWQQAGRSGRRAKPSLAIYVAFEGPLDQYFMKFPNKLFGRPIEHCQVDSRNPKVLEQHLTCAAKELPLCLQYDEKYFSFGLQQAMSALRNLGHLGNNPSGDLLKSMWSYIGPEKNPSHGISLRAIENEKYIVLDKSTNKVLEEIEESRAFFRVYEGAVYLNQGITYLVDEVQLSTKTALCHKADLKYYTKTRDYTDIHVVGGDLAYPLVNNFESEHVKSRAQANNCNVTTSWFGFYKIWKASNQIFDSVGLSLPSYSYDSQAAWIRVPESAKKAVEARDLVFRYGSHAASHALVNVAPLYITCNGSDLGTECANPHDKRVIPERILLYDRHPGGIGFAWQVQALFGELLIAALELVSTCSCVAPTGCPNCVQTPTCDEYNEVLNKEAAIIILKGIIEAEKCYFEQRNDGHENSGQV